MKKKVCVRCGRSDYMVRQVDEVYGIYDMRYRLCYDCAPVDGDLGLNLGDAAYNFIGKDREDEIYYRKGARTPLMEFENPKDMENLQESDDHLIKRS